MSSATLEVPGPAAPEGPISPEPGPAVPDPVPSEQPGESPTGPEVPDPEPPEQPDTPAPDVPAPDPKGPEIPEEARMTEETPKQSDQLPEEGPAEQVPDDVPEAGEGAARESGQAHAQEADRLGYDDEAEQRAYEDAAHDDEEEDER